MVTSVNAILHIVALAATGGPSGAEKVTVSVVAAQATNEGRAAQQNETAAPDQPKRTATMPFLQQGFAPGLRDKPKPKKNGNGDHRHFDAGLEEIRDATASLPFDTYKKLKSETSAIPFRKESRFEINERYTLRLAPLDQDNQGRLRINVSVDEHTTRDGAEKTVTALETTSAIAPNKYVVLGGRLPLAEGQLIICVGTQP